jgi:hypothetical protein
MHLVFTSDTAGSQADGNIICLTGNGYVMKGQGSQALAVYLLHAMWSECQKVTPLDKSHFCLPRYLCVVTFD